jgi:hypothetical protein
LTDIYKAQRLCADAPLWGSPKSVLTIIFHYFFLNHASYILTKYSDFPKMKIFSDLGGIIKT